MLRVFGGGFTVAHVISRSDSWVAALEAAVANFFDLF
jgi:hypothetical protein